jgi:hypothetical protein
MDEETRRKVMHAAAASPSRGRAMVEAAFDGLQAELNRERANALERAGRKLGEAIDRARAFLSTLDHPPTPSDRERYAALCASAACARWELEVTREAMGLRHHGDLDVLYPPPPALADSKRQ